MEILLSFVVGGLFAASVYLILRRNLVRLVIGIILLSNAVNLLIFTMGRMTRGEPGFIPVGEEFPPELIANPLSQALILTAIVIGFGLLAFTLVLVYRMNKEGRLVDSDALRAEEIDPSVYN